MVFSHFRAIQSVTSPADARAKGLVFCGSDSLIYIAPLPIGVAPSTPFGISSTWIAMSSSESSSSAMSTSSDSSSEEEVQMQQQTAPVVPVQPSNYKPVFSKVRRCERADKETSMCAPSYVGTLERPRDNERSGAGYLPKEQATKA